MKKVISISLILLIIICITGNVYAVLKCNVNMKTEKSEYNKGDTVTIDVNISNIESDRGVISFGGTLEYDKDSLKLEKIQGLNGWETPGIGTSYNETNGKFIITRSGLGKNDETMFKLIFTVKNESKQNLVIRLKDISLADGIAPIKINEVNKNITIKEATQNPNPQPGDNDSKPGDNIDNTDNDSKPGNNSNIGNNSNTSNSISKKDNTTANKIIPKTGDKILIFPILIGTLTIISILFVIKVKSINEN